ncbi:pathogenesis-related protein PR-1 [Mercurialis annua]|uniref:pathogenesis-related protein PR-1 n=1 Tax=Mercurialis annua TaxID=3986 RepID=UPI00215DEFBF|nr:pathogenesis-related protein PR-1 [Mercurialis annua]
MVENSHHIQIAFHSPLSIHSSPFPGATPYPLTIHSIIPNSPAMPTATSQCRILIATIIVSSVLVLSASATSLAELTATLDRIRPRVSSAYGHRQYHHHRAKKFSRAKMARQFVTGHNAVRSVFGVQPLKWNKKLARYARRWANQRANDCALQHSPDSPYGENLFWSLKGNWGPKAVVKIWADEYIFYDPKQNVCINGEMCGHYTQVVWKQTTEVGCGRVKCRNNKGFLYVCSYDPPGNIYFQGPFGGRFSKCIVNPPSGP